MAVKIEIVINRISLADVDALEQARILAARQNLAKHVGQKIYAKVNGTNNEQTTRDSM